MIHDSKTSFRQRKPHFSSLPEQQRRNKIEIEKMLKRVNFFLESIGLQFCNNIFHVEKIENNNKVDSENNNVVKVVFYTNKIPTNNKIVSSISIQTEDYKRPRIQVDENTVYKALEAKDRMSLSREKFKVFSEIYYQLINVKITRYKIEKLTKQIDSLFELKKAKGPKLGYFYSVKQKLEYVVKKFILKYEKDKKEIQKTNNIKNLYAFRNKYKDTINDENTILVKFAGKFELI